jgi:hypothetical protein
LVAPRAHCGGALGGNVETELDEALLVQAESARRLDLSAQSGSPLFAEIEQVAALII